MGIREMQSKKKKGEREEKGCFIMLVLVLGFESESVTRCSVLVLGLSNLHFPL